MQGQISKLTFQGVRVGVTESGPNCVYRSRKKRGAGGARRGVLKVIHWTVHICLCSSASCAAGPPGCAKMADRKKRPFAQCGGLRWVQQDRQQGACDGSRGVAVVWQKCGRDGGRAAAERAVGWLGTAGSEAVIRFQRFQRKISRAYGFLPVARSTPAPVPAVPRSRTALESGP
eukprot:364516-Chlamydomonas_euryale.AAC.26